MRSKNPKPSSKFIVSTSSEESSASDRTMDDFAVISTVTTDDPTVSSGRDVGLHAGNETGQFFKYPKNVDVAKKFLQYKKILDGEWGNYVMNAGLWIRTLVRPNGNVEHYQVPSLDRWKRSMDIGDDIDFAYYNRTGAEILPVGTGGMDANVNMDPHLIKQKKESSKNIRASSKGVNHEAVQEALDLAKRDPIRLDTQIRSNNSQLSVAWKSAAEVLKLAATNHCKLVRQHDAEKATLREQFEQEMLIQAFYFWGLSREHIDLALTGKYGEIIFPGDDASQVAEQTPAPLVADDPTKEEVVYLRGKVIEMDKALSRARDFINRTQQVHNKLEYERRLHKSNYDKTFKELFVLQCRYGKIKIERDEVLQKETDRFILLLKSLKDKRFVDESDKIECQRSLLSLTLYFVAEVDTERGLKEAYLELLTERGIVSDPARVYCLMSLTFVGAKSNEDPFLQYKKGGKRPELEIDLRQACDELEWYKGHNACLEREKVECARGELERAKNDFRRYISNCGKDVEVENDKVEDKEEDKLAALSASNKKLSAKLQQCSLAIERTTLLNSKLESEMLELQSWLNAVIVKLSCKDVEILTGNNESELWKESLKKKKLETMAANQQVQDLLSTRFRSEKNDRAKNHEESCSKRDRELNEVINKCNSWIADLDRDKQALVQECIQGNKVFEELHAKYKESQRMMDAAEAEINYSREVDKKLHRLKQEMERSVQITKQYRGSLL
ncbi:hypothetical protein GIB67_016244 [Kingdonia uniflora]|uniref:Uncharacterized protein n=1 Tax=Kingdonia uniflora TaxID=39325 RepID=A0A7J7LT08_9MAGN|nr:hypothetical protein GIB67_016244 [Kingdonia uniflora]